MKLQNLALAAVYLKHTKALVPCKQPDIFSIYVVHNLSTYLYVSPYPTPESPNPPFFYFQSFQPHSFIHMAANIPLSAVNIDSPTFSSLLSQCISTGRNFDGILFGTNSLLFIITHTFIITISSLDALPALSRAHFRGDQRRFFQPILHKVRMRSIHMIIHFPALNR